MLGVLGLSAGEDPSHIKYSRGAQVGRAPGAPRYSIVRAATGETTGTRSWRTGDQTGQIVAPIGIGTSADVYYFCVEHWHWGLEFEERGAHELKGVPANGAYL